MTVSISREQVDIYVDRHEETFKPGEGLNHIKAQSEIELVECNRLRCDGRWGWCSVKVSAVLKSNNIAKRGVAWGSRVSCANLEEFKNTSKYDNLVTEAIQDLIDRIELEIQEYRDLGLIKEVSNGNH